VSDELTADPIPLTLAELTADYAAFRAAWLDFKQTYLTPETDFGIVPGTQSKPTLFKAGSEKIARWLHLRPAFDSDHETWVQAGSPPGLFCYVCRLVDPYGQVVGEGRGSAHVDEGHAKFGRERREKGDTSPWPANVAIKYAEKRAQLDAVLRVGCLSDEFTQDMDDAGASGNTAAGSPRAHSSGVSDRQLGAIYAIGRNERHLSEAETDAACLGKFGRPPQELTGRQASDFIDLLKSGNALPQPASDRPPAQASAPVESRAGAGAQGRSPAPTNGAASLPRAAEASTHENSDPAAHLATAEQIARIRALAAPAGKTVDGLCADLRVVTLGNLSSERAEKLIARLQELAADRAQAVGA
jgi:hypothetical protein